MNIGIVTPSCLQSMSYSFKFERSTDPEPSLGFPPLEASDKKPAPFASQDLDNRFLHPFYDLRNPYDGLSAPSSPSMSDYSGCSGLSPVIPMGGSELGSLTSMNSESFHHSKFIHSYVR